jgi:competence protein ComGC
MKAAMKTNGFTLVELLVSIGIFMLITTMAVVNHSQFNSSVLLTNLAYEVGLSIRQAQVYGITVKHSESSSSKFDSGYGIHFDLTADPKSYTLFEDYKPTGGSVSHDYGAGDADVEKFHIQKGNSISGIYIDGNNTRVMNVDITFIRPNPDAYIIVSGDSARHAKAEICVKSPQGTARKVTVENTGQISVVADDVTICNQ